MKLNKKTYIIGYSIDAVLYARELAEADNEIVFIKTGKLGYPLDDIKECLTETSVNKIKQFLPKVDFKKMVNFTYMFLPYDQLNFVNGRNGLVSYPLNRKSLESAEELEQIEICFNNLERFKKKLDKSTNYINMCKKFFPQWLYNSLIKYIGINKYGGFKQSKLTKDGLLKEINLNYLGNNGSGFVYKPAETYENICKELLNHKNITKILTVELSKLKTFLIERQKNVDVVLMDNRVDYLCNFSQGKFDKIDIYTETSSEMNEEEFIDINEGIVITPMKKYFCIINELGNITKVYSNLTSDYTKYSTVISTINNKKIYKDYQNLLNLYSGKHLCLETFIDGFIL